MRSTALGAGLVAVVAVAVAAPACGDAQFADPVVDVAPAPAARARALTVEEAGLLATGALGDVYDPHADPVPVHVKSERADLDGQRVWRLDLVVESTAGDERIRHGWRLWIGTPEQGPPTVLRAQQRR